MVPVHNEIDQHAAIDFHALADGAPLGAKQQPDAGPVTNATAPPPPVRPPHPGRSQLPAALRWARLSEVLLRRRRKDQG